MKKILWVSAYGPTSLESASNRLRKLSKGLSNAGVNVQWVFPTDAKLDNFLVRKVSKISNAIKLVVSALIWAKSNPNGLVIFSLPPAWLLVSAFCFGLIKPKQLVLDFRDPLVNQKLIPRHPLLNNLISWLQTKTINRATRIILSSPAIGEYLGRRADFITILSGFDPDETVDVEPVAADKSELQTDKLRFLYGGTLYGSRSPMPLLKSLRQLKRLKKSLPIQFDFLCQFNDPIEEKETLDYLKAEELDSLVTFSPMVSKDQFNSKMATADLLVILTHAEGSEYAIPGKVFDYVAAQKPIFLISNDPVLKNLLAEGSLPFYQGTHKVDDLASAIENIIRDFEKIKSNARTSGGSQSWSCLNQGALLGQALFGDER